MTLDFHQRFLKIVKKKKQNRLIGNYHLIAASGTWILILSNQLALFQTTESQIHRFTEYYFLLNLNLVLSFVFFIQMKSKIAAKTGGLEYQWQIMQSLGMGDEEIKQ